jgi:hypothetical protein
VPPAGIERLELGPQVAGDLSDLARHFHSGRTGSDDDEREPGCASVTVRLEFGGLERPKDPGADLQGALERLEIRGELLPVIVLEVVVVRPGRDDQRVEGD